MTYQRQVWCCDEWLERGCGRPRGWPMTMLFWLLNTQHWIQRSVLAYVWAPWWKHHGYGRRKSAKLQWLTGGWRNENRFTSCRRSRLNRRGAWTTKTYSRVDYLPRKETNVQAMQRGINLVSACLHTISGRYCPKMYWIMYCTIMISITMSSWPFPSLQAVSSTIRKSMTKTSQHLFNHSHLSSMLGQS